MPSGSRNTVFDDAGHGYAGRYGPSEQRVGPPRRRQRPEIEASNGLVVEDVETGFCGAVVRCEKTPGGATVTLEDRHGKLRAFPLGPGFLLDGSPVVLVRPRTPSQPTRPTRTASGSVAVHGQRARVARGSRLYVEGRHDAELVERVWGDDLRVEGVVVEYLEGVDHLLDLVTEFAPEPGRRLGVLVDHLVTGSKEARIAREVAASRFDAHVLVVGHPFVDIWQAVKPAAVGVSGWPDVPRDVEWKDGVCAAFAREIPDWPRETGLAWRRILSCVHGYQDLEPELLGRVEQLIDFVTVQG
jgi:hypothetical protein